MKKGISKTAVIYLVLGVTIILMFAIFIYQKQKETEETIFKKIWKKLFPETTETVVIKGTIAGKGGCPIVHIDGANMLAQAMVDCWNHGLEVDDEMPCCYKISPQKITKPITSDDVKRELQTKGTVGTYIATATCSDYVWKVGTVNPTDAEFKVCFDEDGCDEIYATRSTAEADCD